MFAARVSAGRNVQRVARSFATAVESSGVRVAAVDNNGPTSSLTVLVKAGSRYETKQGLANALKNYAFKSTAKRTGLGTVRESDLYGGVLTSTLGREHLALTAEFMRGDEALFLDILSSFITSAKFTRHEFQEYVAPLIEGDAAAAASNPAILALELAHLIAFRQGLGSSLYGPAHPSFGYKDVQEYASSVFTKDNIAVIGTNLEQAKLTELVNKAFSSAPSAAGPATPASTYFGGENRIESSSGTQAVFIGFGVAGKPSPEAAVLAAHLSPSPSIKWSKGTSELAAEIPEGASVESVYLPYSDATLLGLLVQAPTTEGVKLASQAAVKAIKKAAQGISQEELNIAKAKAKFRAANATEAREGLIASIGEKIFSSPELSVASTISTLDAVDAAGFSKTASSLVSSKPTYVAVGKTGSLPYIDELGL